MAIRTEKEEVLRKISKPVKSFDESLWTLLDDMKETMYLAEGVGIAAPQVGLLKRAFIVDIGEGPVEFVNPEILAVEGEQLGEEGCLSVPKRYGTVRRPNYVKMRAQDRNGNVFEIEGKEFMARAMLHEFDHLEGKLFVDLVEGDLFEVE
ncbi:peptide deformylase [Cellulosilyticum lentocellum]|uniref:Peptide deformylase n=1 Tax=Cellulosilyticum lentocellum (strain ATCC 49066 / DSM 5427 / NCIMB 11756 / RHM5) TaxID=642492 RepID=F2JMH8_CELLD|nr:peptide deformylase [Cellulosilyticum lentocellum]ADZ83496.1 peptide deformylase [Cellulosilyticum lentocellum DSM 5427]